MTQYFELHPTTPQPRLLKQAAEILAKGGVAVYPTDSTYALGCLIGEKDALMRIRRLRETEDDHHFSLVCRDLSELGVYARVDNPAFRLLKKLTPGPYTFILPATGEVPRRLLHPKRKTIGLRVPGHPVTQALLSYLERPLISSSLVLPGDEMPITDLVDDRRRLEPAVDVLLDAGIGGWEHTSILDLTGEVPEVVRRGKGAVDRVLAP